MISELEEGSRIEMEKDEEMEEAMNVEATNVSWTDTLQSFETIRCFLRAQQTENSGL
jgi:hypothetical protein